jgi:hypothetical protein
MVKLSTCQAGNSNHAKKQDLCEKPGIAEESREKEDIGTEK